MIIVNLTSKNNKQQSDDPVRLAKYLLYGKTYKEEMELSRVKCKGAINCDDVLDGASLINALNSSFNANAPTRSKDKIRTMHYEISLNAGEHLSDEQWQFVVNQHLKTLDLQEHYAVFAVHKDTDNEHCHIEVSTIHPQTYKVNRLPYERKKLMSLARDLEHKLNLKKDNHGLEGEIQSKGERLSKNIEAKTGQQTLFNYINEFKNELDNCNSWQEFHVTCFKHNIKVKKSGRGIIFETPDPDNHKNTLYVKASSFNKRNEARLTLDYLEKKFGTYTDIKNNESLSVKKIYEGKPVNFLTDHSIKPIELDKVFDKYKKDKIRSELEEQKRKQQIDVIKNIYKEQKKRLYKAYMKALKENMQSEYDQQYLITKLTDFYEQKKINLKNSFDRICNFIKIENNVNTNSFLEYLKDTLLKKNNKESKIILISRKQAKKQSSYNYAELVRKRKNIDYSGGMTEVYMSVVKATSKGQEIFTHKNKAKADFIKDDGLHVIINEYPSAESINDFLSICKNKAENNSVIKLSGNDKFLQTAMELAIKRDITVKLNNIYYQNQYEDRLNERAKHRTERAELRQFSRADTQRRNRSFKKRYEFNRGGIYRGNIRKLRVIESGSNEYGNADTAIKQTSAESSKRDQLTNTAFHNEHYGAEQERASASRSNESSLFDLSKLSMAVRPSEHSSMLLSNDKRDNMGKLPSREIHQGVRWQVHNTGERGLTSEISEKEYKKSDMAILFEKLQNSQYDSNKKKESDINTKDVSPVIAYINERNDKHQKGFKDVLHHQLWADETGDFIFKGIRNFDDSVYAILEQNSIVYLKEVKNYALNKLKKSKRGIKIKIDNKGTIINNRKI